MDHLWNYAPQIASGVVTTLGLALGAIPGAAAIGLVVALSALSPMKVLRKMAAVYVLVFRGLPELLIFFFFYYGLSSIVDLVTGLKLDFSIYATSVCALSLITAAYVAEVLRGAILAVPKGQSEAGISLGLRKRHVWFKVVLPQAMRVALPSLGNVALVLLKDTALASAIGAEELMRKSSLAAGATHSPFVFYGLAAALYLLATLPLLYWQDRSERRLAIAV